MFRLKIETYSAAFHEGEEPGLFQYDAPAAEVARILRDLATKLERGSFAGPCMDANGNRVGKWELAL